MRKRIITTILLVGLSIWATGCSDSPEHRLALARQMMKDNNPDEALGLVNGLLTEELESDNAQAIREEARLIKANAHLALSQFADARKVLETVIDEQPEQPEPMEAMLKWSFAVMDDALGQTDYATSERLQTQFEEGYLVGWEYTDELAKIDATLEAEWARARLELKQVARVKMRLAAAEEDRQRQAAFGADAVNTAAIDRIKEEMGRYNANAEKHLNNVINIDPSHEAAASNLVRLLTEREAWEEVWRIGHKYAERDDVTPALAKELILKTLRMPNDVRKEDERLALAEKIRDAVPDEQREEPAWMLAAAHIHLENNNHVEAEQLVDQITTGDAQSRFEARYLQSWCLFQQEEYERARLILDQIATQASRSAPVLTLHARVLNKVGDTTLAREQCQRAIQADGNYAPARILIAEIDAEVNPDNVMTQWEQILEKDPSDPLANRMKLSHHMALDERKEVERQMRRIENLPTVRDEHIALMIDGYSYLDMVEKMLIHSNELTRRRPDSIAAHLKYAEALLAQGKQAEAQNYIERMKARFPDAGGTQLLVAQLHFNRDQYEPAVKILDELIVDEPANLEARMLLARCHASLNQTEEALSQCEEILSIDPHHVQARALSARLESFAGNTDASLEKISQIDESNIDEMENPTVYAQVLMLKGNMTEARKVCSRAVARGHPDPVLRLLLARIYMLEHDPVNAETHLLALARSQANNRQVYKVLGEFYQINPDMWNTGVVKLQELESVNQPLSRLALAGLYRKQGKIDAALTSLNELVEPLLRKHDSVVYDIAVAIAGLHIQRQEIEQAREVFRRLVDAGVEKKRARMRLIDLSWSQPSAFHTTNELLALGKELMPADESLRSQLLARLARLEQHDKALAQLDDWISREPDSSILLRWKSQILEDLGRHDEAVRTLKDAIRIDPKKLGLRVRLVVSHLSHFDYPLAIEELRQMSDIDERARALALAEMGLIYVRLGLHQRATETFGELEAISNKHEPRVLYAMGKAMAALGMDDQARKRLGDVPNYAQIYPSAQVLLAEVEMRRGLESQARDRIKDLVKDGSLRSRAIEELASLNPRDRENGTRAFQLLRWADEELYGEKTFANIPPARHSQWMRIRVMLLDHDARTTEDFEKLEAALEDWQQLEPNSLQILSGRMAVLARINRLDKARQLYRSVPKLAETGYGRLLAIVVDLPPTKVDQRAPLPEYLVGLATGRPAMARAGAEALETRTTLFKNDLYAVLDRADVTSEKMMTAGRQLATATVALDAGLPRLAESLAENLITNLPDLIPAHGVYAQASLVQHNNINAALEQARRHVPSAGITLYLDAEAKTEAGDYKGAAASLARLLETEPDNVHAHYRLSQILHLAGEHERAITELEKLHAQGGAYRVMVANDLAYLLAVYSPDRMTEAYGIASRAYDLVAQQRGRVMGGAALQDTLGWIEHLRNDDAEAIKYLSRAITQLNDRPEVHYHIGMVYDRLNKRLWAKYHMEQAAAGDEKITEVAKAKAMLSKWGG